MANCLFLFVLNFDVSGLSTIVSSLSDTCVITFGFLAPLTWLSFFLFADGGDSWQFCLGIHLKCSLYFAGPCCGNTLWCLRLPALQQIVWCHHYLVCTARGLRNLNKQTDKNIISTGHSQHVAAALFTRDARHPTPKPAPARDGAQHKVLAAANKNLASCSTVEA